MKINRKVLPKDGGLQSIFKLAAGFSGDRSVEMDLAILWDWDGVVLDSSRQHEESWERMSREHGLPLPEGHLKAGFGKRNQVIIPEILRWTTEPDEVERLGREKEALYRSILKEPGFTRLPSDAYSSPTRGRFDTGPNFTDS